MPPTISVIMPSYNYGCFITEAIESVLAQSFSDWELLIVEDGSTDNSIDIIRSYVERYPDKIRLLTHPNHENRHLPASYKLGMEHARGEYLAFLESDDAWYPDCLEGRLIVMQKYANVILVYNDVEFIGSCRERIKNRKKEVDRFMLASNFFRMKPFQSLSFAHHNFILTFSAVMVRRAYTQNLSIFPPKGFEPWVDWWLWGQIALRGDFFFLTYRTTRWRIHGASLLTKDNPTMAGLDVYGFFAELRKRMMHEARQCGRPYLVSRIQKWPLPKIAIPSKQLKETNISPP